MTLALWACVAFTVLMMICLELGVLTRRAREVDPAEAYLRVAMWVVITAAFGIAIFYLYQARYEMSQLAPSPQPPPAAMQLPEIDPAEVVGIAHEVLGGPIDNKPPTGQAALLQFVTAYVIELALSADNIAVLALLIAFFRLPRELVARALFWAVLASLLVRLGLVLAGAEMLRRAAWAHYVFGGLLVAAMLRMLLMPDESSDFSRSWLVRSARTFLRISPDSDGQRLTTTRADGHRALTPLAVVALCAAVADMTYAFDSVPAVFSVTREPVIAFSASAMAILALRSMYFTLERLIGRFRYLKASLVFVLLYVAAKSFVIRETAIPTLITLGVVTLVMGVGIGASVLYARFHPPEAPPPAPGRPIDDLAELATWRNIRRGTILIVGAIIIVLGVVIIGPLPGPGGIPIVAAGLGLLATEFVWAQRLLKQFRDKTVQLQQQTDKMAQKSNPWLVPLAIAGYWSAVWLITYLLGHFDYPKTAKFIWLASIGTFLPVGYWAYMTLASVIKGRQAK